MVLAFMTGPISGTGPEKSGLPSLAKPLCQQSRRARLAIDFSTGWACISHASDVVGVCVMITSALLRTETERWRKEYTISRPAGSYRWVPWQAWHDTYDFPRVYLSL